MRRPALYSSSRSGRPAESTPPASVSGPAPDSARASRFHLRLSSPKLLWAAIVVLAALLAFSLSLGLRPQPRKLTQQDINAAVLKTRVQMQLSLADQRHGLERLVR